MKNKHLLIGALLVSVFASCESDEGFSICCYIQNDTSKKVEVVADGHKHWINTSGKNNESFTISSGSVCEVALDGNKGVNPTFEDAKDVMLYYLGDSVLFNFEDGTQLIYYKNDTKDNSPYNFNSNLYSYTSDRNSGKLVFKFIE
ncbi:MAG: hypothetical protein IKZ99_02575 [Salinivirgaceae bacterium]|nr:hypothetical protein [Salinivirgaceae bacterium]